MIDGLDGGDEPDPDAANCSGCGEECCCADLDEDWGDCGCSTCPFGCGYCECCCECGDGGLGGEEPADWDEGEI